MNAKTNGGDRDVKDRKATHVQSVWRNPTVVATLGAAVIAGVFGIVEILIPQLRGGVQDGEATHDTETRVEAPFDFSFNSYAKSMADVRRALRKEEGAVAIPIRFEAIAALRSLASGAAPADHVPQSIEILVSYLTFATKERRGVDDKYTVVDDRDGVRVTRDESVIAALGALQAVRKSAAKPPLVGIGSIDFSHINLESVDLSGLDVSHGNFRHAFLSGCVCERTIFDHADLREAVIWTRETSNFRAARFTTARISGSKWSNVDFTGSNIEAASGRPAHWKDIVPPEKQALFR
jgi:hypothetical protein